MHGTLPKTKWKAYAAFHEAGHAVIGHVLGVNVRRISIESDGGGHVLYDGRSLRHQSDEALYQPSPRVRQRLENSIVVTLAGPAAQRRHNPRSPWRKGASGYGAWVEPGSDMHTVNRWIYHLHPNPKVARAYFRFVNAQAEWLVENNWPWIANVAAALLTHGTLRAPNLYSFHPQDQVRAMWGGAHTTARPSDSR